jgi:LmbE family N-acetylglucosaminyl deacetylase
MPETKKKTGRRETIMVICAHPDDEILGVGGTIAKYSQEGKRIISVIFSYGEKSHWWMQKKYTIETRVNESKEAGKVVGTYKTIFLGLKDFELKEEVKRKRNLALLEKVILKYRPSKIFTHSPDDMIYADHKAVWDSVEKVTKRTGYRGSIYVFNIWAHDIRISKSPKLFVDISGTFWIKWKALKMFRSQHIYIVQLYPGLLWNAFRNGLINRCRFAEVFTKIK